MQYLCQDLTAFPYANSGTDVGRRCGVAPGLIASWMAIFWRSTAKLAHSPRNGVPRLEAILGAARVRLRPILMTTLAMIFGMLPLAFEIGSGAEARAPMARAVIGGLITSTILTLVVVPVVYSYFDDLSEWFGRLWHRGTPRHVREAVEEVR